MQKVKFDTLDMRSEFSFPIYFSYELDELENGSKYIDSSTCISGFISRKDGITILELADLPMKDRSVGYGVYSNLDEVTHHSHTKEWYGTTWDGQIKFIFRKFIRIGGSFGSMGYGPISTWEIVDFSVSSQFNLQEKIIQYMFKIDLLVYWLTIPNLFDEKKIDQFKYNDLTFKENKLSLKIYQGVRFNHTVENLIQSAEVGVQIEFQKPVNREYIFQLAVAIRNLFQIFMNKSLGISQIILNTNYGLKEVQNIRENWLLSQAYLPSTLKNQNIRFDLYFHDIKDEFHSILSNYLSNSDLQLLVETYLSVTQFKMPISTTVITLVSAIDTYYRTAKYADGKKIKDSKNKMKKFFKLVTNIDELIAKEINRYSEELSPLKIELLIEEMKQVRDYYEHGVLPKNMNKFLIEGDIAIAHDVIIFQWAMRQVILKILLNGTE